MRVRVMAGVSGMSRMSGVRVVTSVTSVTGMTRMAGVAGMSNGVGKPAHRHRQQASGARDERDQVEIHP